MNITLSLSVAFDEDFEGELADNNDARLEVSLLARSPDPELTQVSNSTFKMHLLYILGSLNPL
jgi:hypothetical protein